MKVGRRGSKAKEQKVPMCTLAKRRAYRIPHITISMMGLIKVELDLD